MVMQFLTFTMNKTMYAFDVRHVQEVLEYTPPIKVPCSEPYIEGLIKSRNEGITVISLSKKFNMTVEAPTKKSRIIVLEINNPTEDDPHHLSLFGVTADDVHEVIALDETEIEHPPKFGNVIPVENITGIINKEGSFIMILDTEKIFVA